MSLPALFTSLPLPAAMRPTAVLVWALNAVLNREPWAKQRLAHYCGRSVALSIGALHLSLGFTHTGNVVETQSETPADVQLTIPTERLKDFPGVLAESNPDALLALVHIQGDAGLAHTLAQIASQIRFDPEAELARFTGDLIAVRLVATVKQLIFTSKRTALHLEGNMAEFLGEESGVLVSNDYYHLWHNRLTQLDQRLQRLEQQTALLQIKG